MSKGEWAEVRTLESYIGKEQRLHSKSRGVFSDLLRRIGVATKVVGSHVKRAGLLDRHGIQARVKTVEESPKEFSELANNIMKSALQWLPSVVGLASRDEDGVVPIPEKKGTTDQYIVLFDPMDGAWNIDTNASVGTIFSVYRCLSAYDRPSYDDFLQPGYKQAAAGYVMYGSSTMFVFTTGHGVHGFTLDPEVGEYILSHENILVPDKVKCISTNTSYSDEWDEPTRRFMDTIVRGENSRYKKTSSRYIGSLVADFHRNLLYGGVFLYPASVNTGQSKLKLTFECAPLAMLIEQAGGLASTGRERILDIRPTELQQHVPLIIGNRTEVELYEKLVRDHDVETGTKKPSIPPPPSSFPPVPSTN
jgi:fructose-1,6-bisphosphatase I